MIAVLSATILRCPPVRQFRTTSDDEEHEEDHVALSSEAYHNLKLSVAPVALGDYTHTLRMPGEIIESPGLSGQHVVSPVSGILTKLFVSPGVSVSEGDPLFELRIIDKQLLDTQLRYLELLTKSEIVETELARITPLTMSGSVSGRKKIELEYEKKKVDASLGIAVQGLTLNGLSKAQVDQIKATKRLITKLVVLAPTSSSTLFQTKKSNQLTNSNDLQLVTWSDTVRQQQGLTVEELHVEAGQNVPQGEAICSLATHGVLLICGHAFENELGVVSELCGQERGVAVEFGIEGHTSIREGLCVQYMANQVDENSQSFQFFIPLPNELLRKSHDRHGRLFRSWRYKVGQRIHVIVPTETIPDQIVLPKDAVVQEGPDSFVFREHIEEHDDHLADHDEEDHDEHEHEEEVFIEFEPVPVKIISRDKAIVVIKSGGQLSVGDNVALSSAYQLMLAMKAQAEGGGGHHHHHH